MSSRSSPYWILQARRVGNMTGRKWPLLSKTTIKIKTMMTTLRTMILLRKSNSITLRRKMNKMRSRTIITRKGMNTISMK